MAGTADDAFNTFGELLKYLRHRARLTQRELSIAVGYSEAQINRLEGGERLPDPAAIRARFLEALELQHEPELAARLIAFAEQAHRPSAAPQEALPLRTGSPPAPTKGNLPARLPRFIGRELDLAEVLRLVRENELVTLTGSGGVGKTRLALEVGKAITSNFPDGVWLVELAPLANPTGVPRAAAEAFRLPEEIGRTYTAALIEHLANQHLLLILDNCEHLIQACAEFAEALLAGCPHLHLLATSREPLQATGEITWRVPSLATPVEDLPPAEQLLGYDAVQLFMSQASAILPGFPLTPENLAAAAQICQRLDGIPLAIEMAAAQVGAMTPREIAARLNERFALLVSNRRTTPPRQRTLRATLDWSYHLLSEPERVLLARLSVFADGCTAELAKAVCGKPAAGGSQNPGAAEPSATRIVIDSSLPANDVLALLMRLVGKSLIVADTRGERTRYRLLETVRLYAAEKLAERGETDATYGRLATHLILPAPTAGGYPTSEWRDRFVAEVGNIRSVIVWAHTQPDGGLTILQLATAFASVSYNVGHLAEPLTWLEEGLAYGGPIPAALRVAALHRKLAFLSFAGYNLGRWAAQAEELLSLSEQVDNDVDRFEALNYAAEATACRDGVDQAEPRYEQALAFARQRSFQHGIVVSLGNLGLIRAVRGDNHGAAELFHQVLQLGWVTGQGLHILIGLAGIAHVDAAQASALAEAELSRLKGITGDWSDSARAAYRLQVQVQALMRTGAYGRAEACARESFDLFSKLNVTWSLGFGTAEALFELGRIAWLQGNPAAAKTYGTQCLDLYRRVGDLGHAALVYNLVGYAALALDDWGEAVTSLRRGLVLFRELAQPAGMVMTLAALAEARGETVRAARLYGTAAAPSESMAFWLTWVDWTFRPAHRVVHDRVILEARRRYENPAHASAWTEGAKMTLDQAVDAAYREVHDP